MAGAPAGFDETPPLSITTHEHGEPGQQGRVLRVEARGEIDLSNAPLFRDALETACSHLSGGSSGAEGVGSVPGKLLVDLRQVTFIDSAGLAVIVYLRTGYNPHCQMTLIVSPATQTARVLRLSQFERFIPIVHTLEEIDAGEK